jgi:hypothetical protein
MAAPIDDLSLAELEAAMGARDGVGDVPAAPSRRSATPVELGTFALIGSAVGLVLGAIALSRSAKSDREQRTAIQELARRVNVLGSHVDADHASSVAGERRIANLATAIVDNRKAVDSNVDVARRLINQVEVRVERLEKAPR